MKKSLLMVPLALSIFASGVVSAQVVRDWRDMHVAELKIHSTIDDINRAAQANGFDMNGHAGKAVQLLKQAEYEVHVAVEAAKVNTTH